MKSAFLKDEALLAEIADARSQGRRCLWWLGQSGFLVLQKGRALLLDPYLSDSLTLKYANTDKPHVRVTERVVSPEALGTLGCIDIITSSHNHTDHLDAETLLPILNANPQSRLAISPANRDFVLERLGAKFAPRLLEVGCDASTRISDLEIRAVPSAHNSVDRDAVGNFRYVGYVIRWDGATFYHSGDTLWHEGIAPALKDFHIDVAMLPINGNCPERRVAGNLNGREASQLAKSINARWVIPCHYDLFEFNTAAPDDFVAECQKIGQQYRVLRNGEGVDFPIV